MPTILATSNDHAAELAVKLLAAAGDDPGRVRTVTVGNNVAFEVDDDLAAKVTGDDKKPQRRTRKAQDTPE